MSSAMNHKRRSRRGYRKTISACGNIVKTARVYEAATWGVGTSLLIFRLQNFRRKVLEHRKGKEAAEE